MPLILNGPDLTILGLNIDLISALPVDEQAEQIKTAWRRLVLATHPDKPGGNADAFAAVNEAYTRLTTGHNNPGENPAYDIDNYFDRPVINIQDDAFDLLMQEGIAEVFAKLMEEFLQFEDERDKRDFATHHASFLTVAEKLEGREKELTRMRAQALYNQQQESLGAFILREWRVVVIRLLAEEYLDDFAYRAALATGDLGPILAVRKLVSPIKWLALIIASLDLVLRGTGEYLTRHTNSNYNLGSIVYIIGAPVSVVNFFVSLMATPVNSIVRPLANYTSVSPMVYTALLACFVAGIIHGLMKGLLTLSLAALELNLPVFTLALTGYSIYLIYQIAKNLRDSGQDNKAKTVGLMFGLIILLNAIPTAQPILDLAWVVGNLCFLQVFKRMQEENPIDYLPLPSQPVSENLKDATLQCYKTAHQSHLLFNTPVGANFNNNRSFWQKTWSFFGVDHYEGSAKQKEPENHLVLALEQEEPENDMALALFPR